MAQDQELALTLALYRQQDTMARCTLQAKVVTVAEDQFTVAFLNVSEEQKAALFQCLVHEVRQDMA